MRGNLETAAVLGLVFGAVIVAAAVGQSRPPKPRRMDAAEWGRAYDDCVRRMGQPVVLASRDPGVSLGVGCAPQLED